MTVQVFHIDDGEVERGLLGSRNRRRPRMPGMRKAGEAISTRETLKLSAATPALVLKVAVEVPARIRAPFFTRRFRAPVDAHEQHM